MFTQEQINELLKNKNVIKCSSKSITYCKDFKLRAVRKYYEDGLSPNMIFMESGFDLNIIGKERPKSSLKKWKHLYNKKGKAGLIKDNRGRPRKRIKIKFNNKKFE